MPKTAILYSGSAYNIAYSLPSQLENLVIPNDADVFILTERRTKRRRTPNGPIPGSEDPYWHVKSQQLDHSEQQITDDELALIRNTFGDRLKVLELADDLPGFSQYLRGRREMMMNKVNEYRHYNLEHNLPPVFGSDVTDADSGNLTCVINQYGYVKKCYELMEQYEQQHGFKYDYIMRARIDFIVPEPISMEAYSLNHDKPYMYVMGSVNRDDFEFSDEFCWFSRRYAAGQLFPFLDRIGMLDDRKYNTASTMLDQAGNRIANEFRFGAETQFAILLKELNLSIINVKIYRSAQFTADTDGYDYLNYKFRRDPTNIDQEYDLAARCETDINEHLPKLREVASECSHITELGTRYGNSTLAFMVVRPEKLITYDVQWNPKIDYLQLIARENNINLDFRLENVEQIELEPTDLLFIDTNHHDVQCSNELRLHADKARKYIVFHDTSTFWEKGQGYEQGHGLRYAIEPFLETHPEWKIEYRAMNNNGLMILKRQQ